MFSVVVAVALLPPLGQAKKPRIVIDSRMTRAKALGSNNFPNDVVAQMQVVDVRYLGFDNREHAGQIVVHQSVAKEVKQIFVELRKVGYPIKRVVPIVKYGWHDQRSINDNNTSAFNYRKVIVPGGGGSGKLSEHSFGRAIEPQSVPKPVRLSVGPGCAALSARNERHTHRKEQGHSSLQGPWLEVGR